MSYRSIEDFSKLFIELIKTTHPELPVVKAYQNVTQPVDILNGEALLTFDVEVVEKVGTDYVAGVDEVTGETLFMGDRLVRVNMELFHKDSLTALTHLRDIWETYSYREKQRELGLMEERQDSPPFSSTRKHSKEKYVVSARYLTKFAMGVVYSAGSNSVGDITNGTFTGTVDTLKQEKTIITNFSK